VGSHETGKKTTHKATRDSNHMTNIPAARVIYQTSRDDARRRLSNTERLLQPTAVVTFQNKPKHGDIITSYQAIKVNTDNQRLDELNDRFPSNTENYNNPRYTRYQ